MLVLLVDDGADIRESYSLFLRDEGVRRHRGGGRVDALEELGRLMHGNAKLPALILLDHTMPRMNGPAFRERQIADPTLRRIPVMMMSAANASEVEALAAVPCIRKPIGARELLRAVQEIGAGDGD